MLRFPSRLLSRGVVLAAISLASVTLGAANGCVLQGPNCARSRSCAPAGGAVNIVDSWTGGSSQNPSFGGGAGEGGLGGLGGRGGMNGGGGEGGAPPPAPEPGDECSPNGVYACAGSATRDQLVCRNGFFVPYGTCPLDQRCDNRPATKGLCQPLVPECEAHLPGDLVCRGTERLICGPDLVTTTAHDACDDACFEGACVECDPYAPPTCEFNGVRSCSGEGQWEFQPCDAATPHCVNGVCGVPPSCLQLEPTCGINEDEPCCSSPLVPGGEFDLGNSPSRPSRVSPFRLDRFEVTVARFRQFKLAWDEGWRPEVGSGKHVHLRHGAGLLLVDRMLTAENGWPDAYSLSTDLSKEALQGGSTPDPYATWTTTDETSERRPINFVSAVAAFAFCIWDGGFLPTDAEWNFAATGGTEQRTYPWGPDAPGADFSLAVHACFFPSAGTCSGHVNIAPVGVAQGISAFEQLDLAGNVAEWSLDTGSAGCDDCGSENLTGGGSNTRSRGGSFNDSPEALNNAAAVPGTRSAKLGIRCARVP